MKKTGNTQKPSRNRGANVDAPPSTPPCVSEVHPRSSTCQDLSPTGTNKAVVGKTCSDYNSAVPAAEKENVPPSCSGAVDRRHRRPYDEIIVDNRWKSARRIGAGSFGVIHLAVNIKDGTKVAIKLEAYDTKHKQLRQEYPIYQDLRSRERMPPEFTSCAGIPEVYFMGEAHRGETRYSVMVMQLLGESLEDKFQRCGQRFSVPTVLMIGEQMLRRVQFIHAHGFIHRDIKPDNFLVDADEKVPIIYVVDFGLSKKFWTQGRHIPMKTGKTLTGTARYTSLHTHAGLEQARRDDVEAIAYVLIYFLRKQLPWQGLQVHHKKEKYDLIHEKKRNTPIDTLCEGMHDIFKEFLVYARQLHFEEEPEYGRWVDAFQRVRSSLQEEDVFDWIKLAPNKKQQSRRK